MLGKVRVAPTLATEVEALTDLPERLPPLVHGQILGGKHPTPHPLDAKVPHTLEGLDALPRLEIVGVATCEWRDLLQMSASLQAGGTCAFHVLLDPLLDVLAFPDVVHGGVGLLAAFRVLQHVDPCPADAIISGDPGSLFVFLGPLGGITYGPLPLILLCIAAVCRFL